MKKLRALEEDLEAIVGATWRAEGLLGLTASCLLFGWEAGPLRRFKLVKHKLDTVLAAVEQDGDLLVQIKGEPLLVRFKCVSPETDAAKIASGLHASGAAESLSPATTTWLVPHPYGHPAAIESVTLVAAPLLAGFTITLIGLVLSLQSLRAPGLALLLLALTTIALLAAVEFGFWAKQYATTPDEIRPWWPDADVDDDRYAQLRRAQWRHACAHAEWASRARFAYNAGIVLLQAALFVTVIPRGGLDKASLSKKLVAAVFAAGFVLEIVWMAATWTPIRESRWFGGLAARVVPEHNEEPAPETGPGIPIELKIRR